MTKVAPVYRTSAYVHHRPQGVIGREGMWVPKYVEQQYGWEVTDSRSWKHPHVIDIFSKDGYTHASNFLVNFQSNSSDLFCPKSGAADPWPISNCTNGKFIPPVCRPLVAGAAGQDVSRNCAEWLMMKPTWGSGHFEGLVMTKGWNFTLSYLGVSYLYMIAFVCLSLCFYCVRPDKYGN